MGKRKDHTGKKYGKWTVISYIGSDKRSKDAIWLCRCECGTEKELKINNLVTGGSRQCIECAKKPRLYQHLLPEPMWNLIVKRARRKNQVLDITRQEAEELYRGQFGKCKLSGLSITFANSGSDYLKCNQTASLDRIDSSKGYEKDNLQWVHKIVNLMKNTLSQEEFLDMCKKIIDHHGKTDRE